MTVLATNSNPPKVLRFKVHVQNGVLVPDEPMRLPAGQTYLVTLQLESEIETEVDALAEIAAMAQPIGPSDLARNFDTYTRRVLSHESAQ